MDIRFGDYVDYGGIKGRVERRPDGVVVVTPDAKNKSLNSFDVEPNAAPSSVPGKRDVFMATLERLLRAMFAPAAGISEVNANVPVVVGNVNVGVPAADEV